MQQQCFPAIGADGRTISYNRYYTVVGQDIMTQHQYEQLAISYKLSSGTGGRNTEAPTAEMLQRCMPFKRAMLNHTIIFTAFALLNLLLFGSNSNLSTAVTNKQEKTSTAWTASWSFDDKFVAIGNSDGELAIYQSTDWKKIKSWNFKSLPFQE
jgi:hypothetical protein